MILQMDLKGNCLQCRHFHTACHPKAASLRQLDAATEEYFVSWTRTLTHPNTARSDLTSILDASLMRWIHICIFIKLELRDLIFCRLSILGSSIYKRLKTPHYNKISSTSMHIIIRNENTAFIHKYMHKNKQNLSMNRLNHYSNTSLKP
jgi:3',5'-cyclic AMP phosphodiesterase CpdA